MNHAQKFLANYFCLRCPRQWQQHERDDKAAQDQGPSRHHRMWSSQGDKPACLSFAPLWKLSRSHLPVGAFPSDSSIPWLEMGSNWLTSPFETRKKAAVFNSRSIRSCEVLHLYPLPGFYSSFRPRYTTCDTGTVRVPAAWSIQRGKNYC